MRHLATLLGSTNEQIMRYFILVVALLLDPAAVLLLFAATHWGAAMRDQHAKLFHISLLKVRLIVRTGSLDNGAWEKVVATIERALAEAGSVPERQGAADDLGTAHQPGLSRRQHRPRLFTAEMVCL